MFRSPSLAAALVAFVAVSSVHAQPSPAPMAPAPTAPMAAPMAAPATAQRPDAAPARAGRAARGDASEGKLAWYGRKFNGRVTASGERYNAAAMTMAHKTLPFGTLVKVTNTANKRSVTLRVNDRGPTADDRIGDVSQAAAKRLGMRRSGTIDARMEVVGMSRHRGARQQRAARRANAS